MKRLLAMHVDLFIISALVKEGDVKICRDKSTSKLILGISSLLFLTFACVTCHLFIIFFVTHMSVLYFIRPRFIIIKYLMQSCLMIKKYYYLINHNKKNTNDFHKIVIFVKNEAF